MKIPGRQQKIILGIDPGTQVMGYGLIAINGRQMSLIGAGAIQLAKEKDHHLRLRRIYEKIEELVRRHRPNEAAIEQPFYGKNVQSMLKLGRAQGVAIASLMQFNIPVYEYAPKRIKQSVTGNGNAGKAQVAQMLKQLLGFKEIPSLLDATDGLAAAVCHFLGSNRATKTPSATGKKKSGSFRDWKGFMAAHPERQLKQKV